MKLEPEHDNLIAELLLKSCDFFKGTDGDCYITVDSPYGKVTLPLDSQEGTAIVTGMYHQQADHIIERAELERGARLAFSKIIWEPAREVYLRVGRDAEHYYLDLKTTPRKYIQFGADGWRIVNSVPIHFREGQGQLPMPEPLKGDTFEEEGFTALRRLLTINDLQWRCLLPLLVSYMLPDIQHPLLLLTGEQNSGKSTFLEIIKTLLDPNSAAIGGDVPDPRNLFIKVNSTWVSTFDNLSRLDEKQQDAVCQIVTGGTYQTRRLYSDAGLVSITAKNPVILSGISNVANRGDLASRAVLFELQSIDRLKRPIPAEMLTAQLNRAQPSILRSLVNLACAVLNARSQTEAPARVRPASYGVIGLAVERVLGWPTGSFVEAYHMTHRPLEQDVIENVPVITALVSYLDQYRKDGEHTIGSTELMLMLASYADETVVRSALWPKRPADFSKLIVRCLASLRKEYGWDAVQSRDMTHRYWKFTYKQPEQPTARPNIELPVKLRPRPKESLGQSVRRVTREKKGGKK